MRAGAAICDATERPTHHHQQPPATDRPTTTTATTSTNQQSQIFTNTNERQRKKLVYLCVHVCVSILNITRLNAPPSPAKQQVRMIRRRRSGE